MSEYAAPVTPSTIVVAVDVGKTTAAISATDTARRTNALTIPSAVEGAMSLDEFRTGRCSSADRRL